MLQRARLAWDCNLAAGNDVDLTQSDCLAKQKKEQNLLGTAI